MQAEMKNAFRDDELEPMPFYSRPVYILTHISLASLLGAYANSTDPDQMPQNAAADQGLHCLLTEISFKNKNEKIHQAPLTLVMESSK